MSDKKTLKVIVQSVEKTMYEGPAERITSFNEFGRFDIYPQHANFISIIGQELILYHNNEPVKQMEFEQAVMKVKSDSVEIFLGIEILRIN